MCLSPQANSLPSLCFIQSQALWVPEVMLILPREWTEDKDAANMGLSPCLQNPTDLYCEIPDPLGQRTETSVLCTYS